MATDEENLRRLLEQLERLSESAGRGADAQSNYNRSLQDGDLFVQAHAKAEEQKASIITGLNKLLRETNSAVREFKSAFESGGQTFGKFGQATENFGSGIADATSKMGGVAKGLGLLTEMTGKYIAVMARNTDYLLKASDDFGKLGSVNTFTTKQISEMGHKAGLAYYELDKMTKPLASIDGGLQRFGNTTSDGVKAFSDMISVTKEQRMQMQRMGLDQENLIKNQADFITYLSRTGTSLTGVQKTGEGLRNASLDYIKNLHELSALTGKDIDKVKQEQMVVQGTIEAMLYKNELDQKIANARTQEEKTRYENEKAAFTKFNDELLKMGDPVRAAAIQLEVYTGAVTDQSIGLKLIGVDLDKYRQKIQDGSLETAEFMTEYRRKGQEEINRVGGQLLALAPEYRKLLLGDEKAFLGGQAARGGIDEAQAAAEARAAINRKLDDDAQKARNLFTETVIDLKTTLSKLVTSANPLVSGFTLATAGFAALTMGLIAATTALSRFTKDLVKSQIPSFPGPAAPTPSAGPSSTGGPKSTTQSRIEMMRNVSGGVAPSAAAGTAAAGTAAAGTAAAGTAAAGTAAAGTAATGAAGASGALKSAAGVLGKIAGPLSGIVSVGSGILTATEGIKDAEKALKEGKITKEEAKEKKGEAIGGGTGQAVGGVGGALAGAAIGTAILPVVGTAIGAAIGGLAGSAALGKIGESLGGVFSKTSESDKDKDKKETSEKETKQLQTFNSLMDQLNKTVSISIDNFKNLNVVFTVDKTETTPTPPKPATSTAPTPTSTTPTPPKPATSTVPTTPATTKSETSATTTPTTSEMQPGRGSYGLPSAKREEGVQVASGINLNEFINFTGASGSLDSFKGLDTSIQSRVTSAAQNYFQATGKKLQINSAKRDSDDQQRLYDESVQAGRPGRTATGMPIAKPGTSKHENGLAVDFQNYNDNKAVAALNQQGLIQTVPKDPVHFELPMAQDGGAFSGPAGGYPVILHKDEIVIPAGKFQEYLKNSENVTKTELPEPTTTSTNEIDISEISNSMREMAEIFRTKLDDLIAEVRDSNYTQEEILKVSRT